MRLKGSRYENTRAFSDGKKFSGYRERKLTLPAGVVEHSVLQTDRLDHLANDYYKSDRRWWRILDANSEFIYGFDMLSEHSNIDTEAGVSLSNFGDVVVIPASRESEE